MSVYIDNKKFKIRNGMISQKSGLCLPEQRWGWGENREQWEEDDGQGVIVGFGGNMLYAIPQPGLRLHESSLYSLNCSSSLNTILYLQYRFHNKTGERNSKDVWAKVVHRKPQEEEVQMTNHLMGKYPTYGNQWQTIFQTI